MEEAVSPSTAQSDALELRPMERPACRAELSELLNRCFALQPGERFLSDFPVWEPALCRTVRRWGLYAHDRLVASAGLRMAEAHALGGDPYKLGIVGGVITDPEFQRRSLASQLLTILDSQAQMLGASTLVLWGSQHKLYQRHGFELCGEQLRVPLGSLQFDPSELVTFQMGYCPGIFQARRAHRSGLILTDEDQLWFSRHVNVQWFWTGLPQAVTAYVGIGRGIDLTGMVHEWGGSPEALQKLLQTLQTRIPECEILGSSDLFEEWAITRSQPGIQESLCMAKSLDGNSPTERKPFWFWGLDSA